MSEGKLRQVRLFEEEIKVVERRGEGVRVGKGGVRDNVTVTPRQSCCCSPESKP